MENNITEANKKVVIPKKFLLSIYLVLPLLFFIFVVDVFRFDSSLLPYMGLSSMLLPLYILFFELPHIFASFFGFFDREYLSHYKRELSFYLPVILITFSTILYFNLELNCRLVGQLQPFWKMLVILSHTKICICYRHSWALKQRSTKIQQ